MEIAKNIQINQEFLQNIIENNKHNELILKYYYKLQKEFPNINFVNNINSLENCNKYWQLDYYKKQKIKDFKKTNLCKDKFCSNCKKVKQASRLFRFTPYLEEIEKNNYLYHLVLTIPNCTGEKLKENINNMFKSLYSLNRYFNGNLKIKGLDFEEYGYIGSIRSLEVTFNKNSYHPHLHCIFAFNKKLDIKKIHKNTYSNSLKNGTRLFSNIEIMIQKIWYLLINKKRVTLKNINDLNMGYSCTMDKVNKNSYYEIFKYMTKTTNEKRNVLTYDNFKTLYFSLYKIRQIQGYGVFYNIKDINDIDNEVNKLYDSLIDFLIKKENPQKVLQTPEDLIIDKENIIISRKRIYKYLLNLCLK